MKNEPTINISLLQNETCNSTAECDIHSCCFFHITYPYELFQYYLMVKNDTETTQSFNSILQKCIKSDMWKWFKPSTRKNHDRTTFFYTLRLTEHVNAIPFFNEIKCKTFYQKGLFFFCACTCQLAGLVLKYLVPKISFSVLCKIASLHNGFISIPIPSKQT